MSLQSNVLEFLVSGSLDGVTANPIFQRANAVSPRPDPPGSDAENIYQWEVENLGVIDLSFPALAQRLDGPVTVGPRYIPWLTIDTGGVVAPAGANVSVGAFRPGASAPSIQKVKHNLEGQAGLYSRQCIYVPHGSCLVLGPGLAALAGTPIIVRFAVLLPQTHAEEELIKQACCCLDGTSPSIPVSCLNPPAIERISPATVSAGAFTLTVDGSSFQEGDTVDVPGAASVGPTTFVNDTQLTVDVTASVGTYDVVVTREGEENCSAVLTQGLDVI